jgi:hypothetical protein
VIAAALPHWLGWFEALYYPESSRWYAANSSIGGDSAIIGSVITGFLLYWHHVNCHVDGCKKIGKPVHGTSHRACRSHHPHRQGIVTAESIAHAAKHGHNAEKGPQ